MQNYVGMKAVNWTNPQQVIYEIIQNIFQNNNKK